jgi:hypothetical protein
MILLLVYAIECFTSRLVLCQISLKYVGTAYSVNRICNYVVTVKRMWQHSADIPLWPLCRLVFSESSNRPVCITCTEGDWRWREMIYWLLSFLDSKIELKVSHDFAIEFIEWRKFFGWCKCRLYKLKMLCDITSLLRIFYDCSLLEGDDTLYVETLRCTFISLLKMLHSFMHEIKFMLVM